MKKKFTLLILALLLTHSSANAEECKNTSDLTPEDISFVVLSGQFKKTFFNNPFFTICGVKLRQGKWYDPNSGSRAERKAIMHILRTSHVKDIILKNGKKIKGKK